MEGFNHDFDAPCTSHGPVDLCTELQCYITDGATAHSGRINYFRMVSAADKHIYISSSNFLSSILILQTVGADFESI